MLRVVYRHSEFHVWPGQSSGPSAWSTMPEKAEFSMPGHPSRKTERTRVSGTNLYYFIIIIHGRPKIFGCLNPKFY